MTVNEMITQIKEQLHDITDEYPDSVLIKYINSGIKSASSILATAGSGQTIKEISMSNGMTRPADFLRFAGIYPIKFADGKIVITSGTSPITVRYFANRAGVNTVTDMLPFTDEAVLLYIEQYACVMALNRNEFDISNDTAILQSFRDEIIAKVE